MPKNDHVPAYRRHKSSGQARVIINQEHIYLGKYGSAESREKYARLISELNANGSVAASSAIGGASCPQLLINALILAYWQFSNSYYVKDGKPTDTLAEIRGALRPLRQLYGATLACEFGPQKLKAVRQLLIDTGLSRGVINKRVGQIKRAFKWAVAEELVPPSVYHGLQALAGLFFGRTSARETEPITAVLAIAPRSAHYPKNWMPPSESDCSG